MYQPPRSWRETSYLFPTSMLETQHSAIIWRKKLGLKVGRGIIQPIHVYHPQNKHQLKSLGSPRHIPRLLFKFVQLKLWERAWKLEQRMSGQKLNLNIIRIPAYRWSKNQPQFRRITRRRRVRCLLPNIVTGGVHHHACVCSCNLKR